MINLKKIQGEIAQWQAHNFPGRKSYIPLLGAVEELGELAHAHIKSEQKIRTNEDHTAKRADAIADVFIYLFDYANDYNLDIEELLEQVWGEVRQRDWIKYPKTGRPEPDSLRAI